MNRLYVKLKKRFITERIDSNVYNLYFFREYMMNFTDEEVYQILQYSSQKFHDYVNFIKKLSTNNKYDNNKIKEISKIIFNSQNGDIKSLKRIVLHTNILNNPDVIEFAHAFIMKDDVAKTKAIANIILNNELYDYKEGSLLKLITYVSYVKNNKQLKILEDLLALPGIYGHKDFIKFVNLIIKNPNATYLATIPEILENDTLFNSNDVFNLVSKFLLVRTDNQEDILFKVLTNYQMLKSISLPQTIYFILNTKNSKVFKYLEYLIENKSMISDCRFAKMLDLFTKTDEEYKMNAITKILNCRGCVSVNNYYSQDTTLNDYQFDILSDNILKCKYEFQVNEILRLFINVKLDLFNNPLALCYFNGIINSNYDYQANTISNLIISINNGNYLYSSFLTNHLEKNKLYDNNNVLNHLPSLMDLINRTDNRDFCTSLISLIKIPGLLEREDYFDILKKYSHLKSRTKMVSFYNILSKSQFLMNNDFCILDYLRIANDNQAEAIAKVACETNIYETEKGLKLIKCLLVSNNHKVINCLTIILLNINYIGFDKAKEIIDTILENPRSIDNILNNNVDNNLIQSYQQLNKQNNLIGKAVKVLKRK